MSIVNAVPLLEAAGGDYQISRSVRLRSSASAYLSKAAPASSTNTTWTLSAWIKRGLVSGGSNYTIFSAASASNSYFDLFFNGDVLYIFEVTGGATVWQLVSSAVFRDPSAWYHVVVAYDTTQATSSNRVKLYVNGVQVTAFSSASYPSLNYNGYVGWTGASHTIGRFAGAASEYFDGYLTEINFVTSQQLTSSSFGETDSITGVWKPKKYAGTYGTNGFYLNFSDNSNNTATTIGKDSSGNGNNWTPNNVSVTAGNTYDSMLDVPTPYADGGNGRGNYCVINSLDTNGSAVSITNGNLTFNNSSTVGVRRGTFGSNSGKIYFEITQDSTVSAVAPINYGIASVEGKSVHSNLVQAATAYTDNSGVNKAFWRTTTAGIVQTVTPTTYSMAVGDIFQVAYDATTGKVWFGQNNVWFDGSGGTTGNPSAGTNAVFTLPDTTQPMAPIFEHAGGNYTATLNCGQRPFAYTPPTGFKALNTQNLSDATIKKGKSYFDANIWTGTGATQSITNGGFQPDLVWVKSRSAVANHNIVDSVRGLGNTIYSNSTAAEGFLADQVTALNSNGFTLGADTNGGTNYSGRTYVGWQWKESVSAGFDIVTFTAPASGNFTVNHSLGVTPAMVIVKNRTGGTASWYTWHKSFSNALKSYVYLDGTAAVDNTTYNMWGASGHNSTTLGFTVGTSTLASANEVAYAFAEVAGFSKFGSYTGNGSADGPFVNLGFRPKFVLIKRTDTTSDWNLMDTSRDTYNQAQNALFPNLSNAEAAGYYKDFLSNGFKIRDSGASINASGGTYIYAAFAENPFKNSLAR